MENKTDTWQIISALITRVYTQTYICTYKTQDIHRPRGAIVIKAMQIHFEYLSKSH